MNKLSQISILFLISAFGIYFAFRGENFDILWNHLLVVKWHSFMLSVILLIISVVIRAKRWQYILKPVEHIPLHPLFASTMIGYFGNSILFFRLGELLRAYSVSVGRTLTVSQAFGTVMLERIIDAFTVVIILLLLLPWIPMQNSVIQLSLIIFIGTTVIAITIIIISYRWNWLAVLKRNNIFKHGIGEKLLNIIEKIFDGLTMITRSKHMLQLFIFSALLWITYFTMTYYLLDATHLDDIGLMGAGIILVMGSIAIAIPALPGGMGTYDAGVKFAIMLIFSVSSEEALNFALVSHASNYFPFLIIGSIYFIFGGIRLKDINRNLI